jgi:hypothetical protein
MNGMHVYEAAIGLRNRTHAVMLTGALLLYEERRTLSYRTACNQLVSGSWVRSDEFDLESPENCARCVTQVFRRVSPHDLEARMEDVLAQLDRGQKDGLYAQDGIKMHNLGGRAESVIEVHGRKYRLSLEEAG